MNVDKTNRGRIQDLRPLAQSEAQRVRNHLDELKRKTQQWIAQQDRVPLYQPGKMPKVSKSPGVPKCESLPQGSSGAPFYYNFEHEIAARRAANIKRITLEYVACKAEGDGPPIDKTWIDFAPFAMEAQIASKISDLEILISKGNKDAIVALARLARTATGKLSSLTPANIKQLKRLACRCVNWPVLRGISLLHSDDDWPGLCLFKCQRSPEFRTGQDGCSQRRR